MTSRQKKRTKKDKKTRKEKQHEADPATQLPRKEV